jgi:chromosomal replication initiation ATPase DnaA
MKERQKTVDTIRKMEFKRNSIRSNRDFIIKEACICGNVDYDEFMANRKSRKRIYAYPRFVCMVIMHYALMYTQEETEHFFMKGHPSVISSKNELKNILHEFNSEYRNAYEPVLRYANKINPVLFTILDADKIYPELKDES